jgi:hypothetical protein
MANHDIIFDIENKRIGMVESRCNGTMSNLTYLDGSPTPRSLYGNEDTCKTSVYMYIIITISVLSLAVVILLSYFLYRIRYGVSSISPRRLGIFGLI